MQGGIAQTIGLVLAANARLRGLTAPGWPEGSAFTFCNSVRFEGRRDTRLFGLGRSLQIDDPNQWLDTLPAGTRMAQLAMLPRGDPNISDRNSVGFAGGGPVILAQIAGTSVESWHGEWHVTRQDEADQRIWSVTYRNHSGLAPDLPTPPLDRARGALIEALDEATRFSTEHNMGFLEMFDDARTALDAADPLAGYYHADMIPDGLLPLPCRQLFAGAAKAWVFGGMGSWNDVWFEGEQQARYQAVSDALFSAIMEGLTTAANASAG